MTTYTIVIFIFSSILVAASKNGQGPARMHSGSSVEVQGKNQIGSGQAFSGQGTYFNPDRGACGSTATSADFIVALNRNQYGDMSRKSPACYRNVLITNKQNGRQVTAKIQDACPGCNFGDLDMSPAVFKHLANMAEGVINIKWEFM